MRDRQTASRRRWLLFAPFGALGVLAVIWSGLWFYAARAADDALAGWRAREAKSGRTYQCGRESIGGFPFRIEVRCHNPVALIGKGPQRVINAADFVVLAQIYQPTLLVSEFTGPVTVSEPGRSPEFVANWTLGQASVRGTPRAPQRASLAFDDLIVRRGGAEEVLLRGKRVELHGRLAEGSVNSNPVIDLGLRATAATVPEFHALTATPTDAVIAATIRGLADFSPKPWPDRFRELQVRGGRIDVVNARLQQGDVIAVSAGSLRLTERGNLDGELQMTVVGIEKLIKQLDLEAIVSQGRVGSAIDKLDRLIPGLGTIARKNAAPGILVGLDAIGKRTSLEGKPAMSVPLRFVDGVVMLGPIPVGRTPPLF
ncbi:MAG: DUF2125 domain-containing protein [Hyphomicrobiales bacterium]|nr:DUF2125 domain-containing protein [Hyphomicrobiales bacterium]